MALPQKYRRVKIIVFFTTQLFQKGSRLNKFYHNFISDLRPIIIYRHEIYMLHFRAAYRNKLLFCPV